MDARGSGIEVRAEEMEHRIRSFDWSTTPLGPSQQWPQSLRTVVNILLSSRFQMWMAWGPELTMFYNEAYRPTLGIKHPRRAKVLVISSSDAPADRARVMQLGASDYFRKPSTLAQSMELGPKVQQMLAGEHPSKLPSDEPS